MKQHQPSHRDISIENIIHHGNAHEACLIDFGTAVKAPTGACTAVNAHSITGTSIFMARSVLEGGAYTLSSEHESLNLMYVMIFLAVDGAAHWGKKPVRPATLSFKVESFSEQEIYERCVIQRCCPDLVKVVRELRNFFWQRIQRRSLTEV